MIGAGVAGLAAIGPAISLGPLTYAFDVRPEVAEQVQSMRAKLVLLDFADQREDSAVGLADQTHVPQTSFATAYPTHRSIA
jgi:NAD(P) transhydrogenase subunit alpha